MKTDPVTLACLKLTVTVDVVPLDRPFKTPSRTVSTGTGFFFDATPFLKGWAVDPVLLERHEDRAMILTCAHVVESAVKVQVSYGATGSRDLHDAEILCVCHEHDLAVLSTKLPAEKEDIRILKCATSIMDSLYLSGRSVRSYGFPLSTNYLQVGTGTLGFESLDNTNLINVYSLQHTCPISPGNSGGPLVAFDAKGQNPVVIGVNSSGIVDATASNIAYAVPIPVLGELRFSSLLNSTPVYEMLRFGVRCNPMSDSHREQAGNGVAVFESPNPSALPIGSVVTHIELPKETLCFAPNSQKDSQKYEVDKHGLVKLGEHQVPLGNIFSMLPNNSAVTLFLSGVGAAGAASVSVKKSQTKTGMRRMYSYPDARMPFLCAFGLCLAPVNADIHLHMRIPMSEASMTEAKKDRVVVCHVFPGSFAFINELASPGVSVISINKNTSCSTIEDVRNILRQACDGNDKDMVCLQLSNGADICMSLEELKTIEKKHIESNLYARTGANPLHTQPPMMS